MTFSISCSLIIATPGSVSMPLWLSDNLYGACLRANASRAQHDGRGATNIRLRDSQNLAYMARHPHLCES